MSFVADPERYARMQYNRVGRSGLKLPALSLGLWHNFGHDRPLDTQQAIVRRAFDLGSMLDGPRLLEPFGVSL